MNESELASRLVGIVARERRASMDSLRDVHDLSLEERVAQGEALRGLTVVSRDGSTVKLACRENISRFREGDLVWLSAGEPRSESAIACALRDVDPVRAEITIELESRRGELPAPNVELVLDRRDLDLADRALDAIRAVLSQREEFAAARALLLGRAKRRVVEVVGDEAAAASEGLDPEQTKAFLGATSHDFELVQGPPGAGKTRLATAVIRAFLRAGKSVCVTAFTHKAVNNVVVQLARSMPADSKIPIFKIERGAARDFATSDRVNLVASARQLPNLRGPCVVGVTTHSAAALLGRRFDLVLIDEAGQVSLPQGVSALALGSRHVLVGDHRQLPPLVVGSHRDPLARQSLFELLHSVQGSRLLTTTYRLNAELCEFPSRAFYEGRLQSSAASASRGLMVAPDDPWFGTAPAALVVPLSHHGARVIAPTEARIAADLVARAIRLGVPPEEIAVIAPHRAQGNRIRALLRERLDHLPPARRPLVDTVERLQGGERDVIILSLTASDPEAVHRDAEFFFSPNRLNVSLTRARKKLIVLMSQALLEAWPDDARAAFGSELLRRIYRTWPSVSPPEPEPPDSSTSSSASRSAPA